MNVTPRQLRMFLALAQSLNFSKTAQQLFMTQPSLSKAIRDLEAQLDVRLFERTTRSVRLTAAGAQLAAVARSVVGEFDAGLLRLRDAAEREARQLAIACLPSLACAILPQVCHALEKRYAASRIIVHDCSNEASIRRLLDHAVDFSLASAAPSHPDLRYQEIARDRFALVFAARWKRHIPVPATMDDLVKLPLISMTDASTAMRYMSAAYLQRGMEFRPKMQFDQVGTIASFVRQGAGIAVLPYLGALQFFQRKGLCVVEIKDGPVRSVGIVTRRLGTPSAMADMAMAEVRAVTARLVESQSAWVLPASRSLVRRRRD